MAARLRHDGPGSEGLYRRLVWLTLLRIALVTLLLGASGLILLRSEVPDLGRVERVLYAVILGTYAASLVYLYLLRRRSARLHRRLAYAQVCGDVVIAACLVYLTGGAESIIVFMFPLTVVSAAVLLHRRGAIVAALLSSVALVAVAVAVNQGALPLPATRLAPVLPPDRLAFSLLANIAAIFLTAALASYLSEQARTAHEKLSVREHDYYALELLHESIVRSVPSGIVAVDRFGLVRFLNRAAERIAVLDAAAALGAPLEVHLPSVAQQLAQAERAEFFEVDHLTARGERRRLRCARSPLLDREGRDHGFVLALEDLTDIRAMEEAIKRSERLAAIGAMAAGLAHELRNPLASMSGSIQLLGDGKAFSADDEKLMRIVLREADRLNGLVKEFLQFARPSPAVLEPFDLGGLVESTVTLFRNDPSRRGVAVEVALEAPLTLCGDAGQIGQVLWNLLANAADAMPEGGVVQLSAHRREAAVELVVRDQGVGIAPEHLLHVFDPFFTTKEHGTGLGLAAVHGIVQGHGGQIEVDSAPGQGATFSVKLPAPPESGGAVRPARGA